MAIFIYYIGPHLDGMSPANNKTLAKLGVEYKDNKDIGSYEDFFEITPQGMPFNISEYGAWIADTRESEAGKAFNEE